MVAIEVASYECFETPGVKAQAIDQVDSSETKFTIKISWTNTIKQGRGGVCRGDIWEDDLAERGPLLPGEIVIDNVFALCNYKITFVTNQPEVR